MKTANNYESQLWKLLEKQQLADLSRYHQPGFFDEVPLYSRESDIDFLPANEKEATAILLRFALKFLKSVVAYESHRTGYVAAITVWDFSDAPIVPNLFVWCAPVRELKKKLVLQTVTTAFGKRIKRMVPRPRLDDPFEVLEDVSTVPDSTRLFFAPARPSYAGFVTLDQFRSPAPSAKSATASARNR